MSKATTTRNSHSLNDYDEAMIGFVSDYDVVGVSDVNLNSSPPLSPLVCLKTRGERCKAVRGRQSLELREYRVGGVTCL
jgi:hypothetical protein